MNDEKTTIIKKEILNQYVSVRAFAKASGIPHGTIVSALNHGIEGMAYDRVLQICDMLKIDYVSFEPCIDSHSNLSDEDERLLAYYRRLSEDKKGKVIEYIKDIT